MILSKDYCPQVLHDRELKMKAKRNKELSRHLYGKISMEEDGCITLTMEAVRWSETSVNIYQTTLWYIPEDSHLHAHRREN
jgi:uncharacterized protein VirK/YbjX